MLTAASLGRAFYRSRASLSNPPRWRLEARRASAAEAGKPHSAELRLEYLLRALQPTRWGKVSARLVERIILYNSRVLSVRAPECLLGKEREVPLSESHPTPEDMPTWRLGPGMNQERSGTRCEPQSANCGTSCRNLV